MRPPRILAALLTLVCSTPAPAQPRAGPHPGGFAGGAFATGRPMAHPGFAHMHPGHVNQHPGRVYYSFGWPGPFGAVATPFGRGIPFGFAPGYGPGYYGYGDGYYPSWPSALEDQPPPPIVLIQDPTRPPAVPARWGSSTLVLPTAGRDPRSAVITVRLPADAALYVQGQKQEGPAGPTRQVVTPPLERGRSYGYEVKAVWTQDGHMVERVQELAVRAGDQQSVTFLPEPPE